MKTLRSGSAGRRHHRLASGHVCALTLLLTGIGLLMTTADASPVSYDESVSGDLNSSDPLTLFTLDVGLNTVTGTAGNSDSDSFAFSVPTGMAVLSASIAAADNTGNPLNLYWYLYSGSANLGQGTLVQQFTVPSPGSTSASSGNLPLTAGLYNFTWAGLTATGLPASADYTFSLTVAPIPIPAAVWLFGGALGALGWLKRRQTNA